MGYQVLARKWRPGKFADLVGQEHVVSAVSNALNNQRLHHAYLFTGTRGVGKTTIARIFAKSLNCEQGMTANPCGQCGNCKDIEAGRFVDLLEIDAASRTKVEDTRELLDNVQYKPTRGEYKVYLIDEVHMLSKHSFNALLKTLEEPPPHVKFLLATTDPQKLPITILSRCLQFNLKALSREQISGQLQHILAAESIQSEPQALSELAKAAQGSMRDALSLTDQAIAQGDGHVSSDVVNSMLGLMDRTQVLKLLNAIMLKDKYAAFEIVSEIASKSPDYQQVMAELLSFLHQIALTQFVPDVCKLETSAAKSIYYLASKLPPEQVQLLYQIVLQGRKDLQYAADGLSAFEMTLLRMLAFIPENSQVSPEELMSLNQEAQKKNLADPSFSTPSEVLQGQDEDVIDEANVDEANVDEEPLSAVDPETEALPENTELESDEALQAEMQQVVEEAQSMGFVEQTSDGTVKAEQEIAESVSQTNQLQAPEMLSTAETIDNSFEREDKEELEREEPEVLEPEEHNVAESEAMPETEAVATTPAPESSSMQAASEQASIISAQEQTPQAVPASNLFDIEAQASQDFAPVEDFVSNESDAGSYHEDMDSYFNPHQNFDSGQSTDSASVSEVDAHSTESQANENQSRDLGSAFDTGSLLDLRSRIKELTAVSDEENSDDGANQTREYGRFNRTPEADTSLDVESEAMPEEDISVQEMPTEEEVQAEVTTASPEHSLDNFAEETELDVTSDRDDTHSDAPESSDNNSNLSQPSAEEEINAEQTFISEDELSEDSDEEVDFDVPFRLDGKKVVSASQLDTWSQLLEQSGLTGLPKQVALHSNYLKNDDKITLVLCPEKDHINNEATRSSITEALQRTLQQDVELEVRLGEVKDTPFAVQTAINKMRLTHAKQAIASDAHISTLCNEFGGAVMDETIKAR